jgi:hypothetical protein
MQVCFKKAKNKKKKDKRVGFIDMCTQTTGYAKGKRGKKV